MSRHPFVHLHTHTEFSLLDGGQKISDLVRRACELEMPSVAMTDHGNLFGVVPFYKTAKKNGIRPVIGCEAYLAPGSRFEKTSAAGTSSKKYFHLLLLAETQQGFKNLVKLASYGYTEGFYYKPRIDREILRAHSEGLICLSGCLSAEIPTRLMQGDFDEAERLVADYQEIFGEENFFLEMQDHGIPEQKTVNEGIVKLHGSTGVSLVATNDTHYLTQDDHSAHDVLICIGTGKKRDDANRMTYSREHYFKTYEEMAEVFPEHLEALENSVSIAERCDVALDFSTHHLPDYPVEKGATLDSTFRDEVLKGFEERRPGIERRAELGGSVHPLSEYEERLEREIATILEMKFPGYFLITADFIQHARSLGIPVGPGRGSAAGSLVAYCLGITNIDPLAYDLLFERFLNPERVTMPDIDIDFCFRRRGEVIDYVTQKYGRENVAQIITFGTMAARAAIRDAGRVLDIAFGEVDKIAKLVPEEIGAKLDDAIKSVPQLKEMWDGEGENRELLDVALRIEGMARHASVHAAGVVITPEPVDEFVPLFKTGKDEITTQWAMKDIEAVGLLKMDFLGLKTLTLIQDCLELIERSGQKPPNMEKLPLDDDATFELFSRGDTSGVFQFESSGMRDILRRMRPEKFEDLIALNALYRPGPLRSGMIEDFIQRRRGKVNVSYPHPLAETILAETYGVIVYQEQVMQIASAMGGYSLGGADLLRRAMGKKDVSVMEAEQEKFVEGAKSKGIDVKDAESVFELMSHFAGYGFNKSHSAAYALVAYQTAYLKAHFKVPFMAALLTNEIGNTDKLVEYVGECRGNGIEISRPDVNRSGRHFEVEGEGIRFGLAAVKGLGEGVVEMLIEARERVGGLSSIDDICCELDRKAANRRVLEALIKSGAMDDFGDRAALVEAIDSSLERGARIAGDRSAGQGALFMDGEGEDDAAPATALPQVPPWSDRDRLAAEKESLGFYLQGHPLDEQKDRLAAVTTHAAAELSGVGEVVVGGLITVLKRRRTRKGDWMATFTLEDTSGQVGVVVFPKLYDQVGQGLEDDQPVVVTGRIDDSEGDVRLFAEKIEPLDGAETISAGSVTVTLDPDLSEVDRLKRIEKILADHPGDDSVYFEFYRPGRFRVLLQADGKWGVRADRDLLSELRREAGDERAKLGRPVGR